MRIPAIDDYQILVSKLSEEDGRGFFAEPIDMPDCGVDGDTPEEAISECRTALRLVFEALAAAEKPIPPARDYSMQAYSGHFILRIPRSLHQRLALRARSESVSLNQLCVHLLSEALARREIKAERENEEAEAPGQAGLAVATPEALRGLRLS